MARLRRNSQLLQSIAGRIRAERAQRSWTQERLAAAAGLDTTTIAKVEAAGLGLSLTALAQVASAFDLPVGALLVPVGENVATPRMPTDEDDELFRLVARLGPKRRSLLLRLARELSSDNLVNSTEAVPEPE